MAELLLGVDAGTTLLKAALYAADGRCLGNGEATQGVNCPQPGWVEQDPASWWQGMRRAVRQALRRAAVGEEEVGAIGISTQGGTLAAFDGQGNPHGPALVWSDARQRATGRADPAADEEHFALTGVSARGGSVSVIVWLQAHHPEWFRAPYRIGYVPDYLVFRLTGEWVSDPTNLGISNLCDLRTGDIALAVIARLGVPREAFARTCQPGAPAGELTPTAARALGLRAGIPVAAPAHDQYAAALGAGCIHEGDLLLSAGTAWVVLLTTGQPIIDRESSFRAGRHAQPGLWGLLGAISSGSSTLDCLLELTRERRQWDRINAAAAAIPAGSDGLLVIPHLLGRTLPTRASHARGAILGWALGHGRAHLWRAAMEGVALETRAACAYLAARGARVEQLRMVGGAARSPLWPSIVASVLRTQVRTCAGENIATRGAACLAARALGAADLPEVADWHGHDAVAPWCDCYDGAYTRYQEAIERLEEREG